jgi:hypothetical protein
MNSIERRCSLKIPVFVGFGDSKTCTGVYRFGFNGQEKDDEVAGAGNIMTAEFWEYDARLSSRCILNPKIYVWLICIFKLP